MFELGRKTFLFFHHLGHRFAQDDCALRATSLAYSTLLTLVPLLMVSVYVLSFFPAFKGAGETLQNFILSNFVAASANTISKHVTIFLKQLHVLSWTSLIGLFVVSLLMIYNMVRAFNAIWQVRLRKHFALFFLLYLGVLIATPIIFGVLLFVTSYVESLPLLEHAKNLTLIKGPAVWLLPYFAAFLTFTFFNWVLPSCKVKFTHAMVAGLVTTVLFEIAKHGFIVYITQFASYRVLYGALAAIPIFLIWMYVFWLIVLFGALICNSLAVGVTEIVTTTSTQE